MTARLYPEWVGGGFTAQGFHAELEKTERGFALELVDQQSGKVWAVLHQEDFEDMQRRLREYEGAGEENVSAGEERAPADDYLLRPGGVH